MEKLELDWKIDVLNRIDSVHPNVAKYVVDHLARNLEPITLLKASDPYLWINPQEMKVLEEVLKSLDINLRGYLISIYEGNTK